MFELGGTHLYRKWPSRSAYQWDFTVVPTLFEVPYTSMKLQWSVGVQKTAGRETPSSGTSNTGASRLIRKRTKWKKVLHIRPIVNEALNEAFRLMRDLHVISIGLRINWEFGLSIFRLNGTWAPVWGLCAFPPSSLNLREHRRKTIDTLHNFQQSNLSGMSDSLTWNVFLGKLLALSFCHTS